MLSSKGAELTLLEGHALHDGEWVACGKQRRRAVLWLQMLGLITLREFPSPGDGVLFAALTESGHELAAIVKKGREVTAMRPREPYHRREREVTA